MQGINKSVMNTGYKQKLFLKGSAINI